MEERGNQVGNALLGIAGLCWVSTVIADGTGTLGWFSAPSILLFAAGVLCLLGSLWAFGLLGSLWKPRRRSGQSLAIGGAVFGERDHETLIQLTVTVRNEAAPTTLHQWQLDVEANGQAYRTRPVVGEAPLYRSLDVPMLDKVIGSTPLATGEITGLLQFAVPGVSQAQLVSALDSDDQPACLRLTALTGTRGDCKTERDLRALKAEKHEIAPSTPQGSFVIGGPGATVRNSSITDSYSDNPAGFGGIYGDTVENSEMSGNVHDPPRVEESDDDDDDR